MEPIKSLKQTGASAGFVRPFRILLIEDSKDNQFLIRAYLKQTAYELDTAENGSVGLQKYVSGNYDLVFMDMQMPVMDGYMATRLIRDWEEREGQPSTPIIAFTANAMLGETARSLDAGCTGHVTKPLRKNEFLEIVARYTGKQQPGGCETGETLRKIVVQVDRDLEALMPRFMDHRRNDIALLQKAIDQQDYAAVSHLAHGLKGAGTGYGFDEVTTIAAALEEAAKERDGEAIYGWVERLAEYMDRVKIVFK
jgi:CheY-like chemotaxis protein/HPt (histidine-containing phosphotransfer) domain-containing protein